MCGCVSCGERALTFGQCFGASHRFPQGIQSLSTSHRVMIAVEENISLAPFTTFRIGGPARFFVRVQSLDDIREAVAFARIQSLPLYVLGGGSNTLFHDDGFNGVVIKIELSGIEECVIDNDHTLAIAAAGEDWDAFVAYTVARGLWGVENLSGIPGVVGASPVQNIGAYGAEVSDTIAWVEVLDVRDDVVRTMTREECMFGYRMSEFKKDAGRYVVLRVAFMLAHNAAPRVSYQDVAAVFGHNMSPMLSEVRAAILSIRASKFPDLSHEGTAGSFFLNPIITSADAERIAQMLPGIPHFPQKDGRVKLSLAYILDHGLNMKGVSVRRARLFEKQPLVLVAQCGASSHDVCELASLVQVRVRDVYGIDVAHEVQIQ